MFSGFSLPAQECLRQLDVVERTRSTVPCFCGRRKSVVEVEPDWEPDGCFGGQRKKSSTEQYRSMRKPGSSRQPPLLLMTNTHRVAISNQRLVELRNGCVSFHYKDCR
jgi:hypothetical protein